MKRVVVIGGGFVGSTIAKRLQRKFEVTLIDNKPYFEFTPGILRTIVHPTNSRCMQVEHKDYLNKTNIIVEEIKKIDFNKKIVYLKNKKIIYDYLVIATGSSYRAPFKHPALFSASRAKELAVYNRHIVDGKHVLIIGGGLVGVELAGEIGYYYCGKNITLVASGNALLERMPLKAQEYAKKILHQMRVEIIFNELVTNQTKKVFIAKSGKKLNGEIGFSCVGITPNTSFLKNNKNLLDDRGFVKVDNTLMAEGLENVFVGGDITNIREEKTGQNAEKHGNIIADNIIRKDKGEELLIYKNKKSPIVISLGPRKGIFVWNNFVLTGFVPAMLKWIVEKKELLKKRL